MTDELRDRVRRRYAVAAVGARDGDGGCCGSTACCGTGLQGGDLSCGSYSAEELGGLPGEAVSASLGCGNPLALAALSAGEVVLDLGSGGGIDVLLSARRVSPRGRAYGLDMTDEMLELAHENQRKAGVENVEFLKGWIEAVPLPDDHVDVVLSNCVINLSVEKDKVIQEAFRVLKPGGRFAVSDVVFLGSKKDLPDEVARKTELWTGCVAGALEKDEYEGLLRAAGFEEVSVEVTNVYDPETMGLESPEERDALHRVPVASAFVRGRKPVEKGQTMQGQRLELVEENGRQEERVARLVALGRALSDPIRVKMLGMMTGAAASGRGCCELPDLGVPADEEDAGICVCEFEGCFGMGQSKVSYHMRKLKEVGLVEEEKRGKWSFYSLDRRAAEDLLGDAAALFSLGLTEKGEDACC